jgi:1-acyl-sn-glycerol-3-phosphate acyltransferase
MTAAILASASRLVAGASVQWHCDPGVTRPRVYFANHTSHLDFVVIWAALPAALRRATRPVAGRDYWESTPVRRYLARRVFQAVLINRSGSRSSDPAAAQAAVERMGEEIRAGHSLIVFPEGTRTADGRIGPFKSGLFHLSRLCPDVELIPVLLDNLNRILPKGEVLPVPMLSRVVFGAPLMPPAGLEKGPFLETARDALIRLKDAP